MRTNPKKPTTLRLGLVITMLLCAACSAAKKASTEDLGPLPRIAGKHDTHATPKRVSPPSAAKVASTAKTASATKPTSAPTPTATRAAATKPVPTATQVAGLEVKRVVFAKNVVNREPVDTGKSFSHAETPKVWVFLELANATESPITLDVQWQPLDGAPSSHAVQLSVPKSKRWRTQAFISTDKKPGTYRCIIRTAQGAVLLSENVEITA